jgi:hypothetical protein
LGAPDICSKTISQSRWEALRHDGEGHDFGFLEMT